LTRLIVFDFDGVIADSESLANAVLAARRSSRVASPIPTFFYMPRRSRA
jgi:phosphoglycolate phosphatase-like HAD superfamily hydrolase